MAAANLIMSIVTHSSVPNAVGYEYETRLPGWLELEKRVHRLAQSCLELNDQYREGTIDATALKTQLIEVIAPQVFTMREEVKKLSTFVADHMKFTISQVKWRFQPFHRSLGLFFGGQSIALRFDGEVEEENQFVKEKVVPLLEITVGLYKKIDTFYQNRIENRWTVVQSLFEEGLTSAGISVGWLSAVRGYLPTRVGGTWPHIDAVYPIYEKTHREEMTRLKAPEHFQIRPALEPSDPPTMRETEQALESLKPKLSRLLITDIPEMPAEEGNRGNN